MYTSIHSCSRCLKPNQSRKQDCKNSNYQCQLFLILYLEEFIACPDTL